MATDVPMVHAAYGPLRQDLLASGLELWELQAYIIREIDGFAAQDETLGLHTKMMVLNETVSVIGSANFDPVHEN